MAFAHLNGYEVEQASSKIVYENLVQEIMHINGKGCIDTYTKPDAVESVHGIDIFHPKLYAPMFRKLGGVNNGKWHNSKNDGIHNAPEANHWSIDVDIVSDFGVPVFGNQTYSNKIALKEIVMTQLVKVQGLVINIVTFSKQLLGFFRDSFSVGGATQAEINKSIFTYNPAVAQTDPASATNAFLKANNQFNEDGCPNLGALFVPADERQAFIYPSLNLLIKGQYLNNASEASAMINATGYINPFTQSEGKRVDLRTGICGMYDGVLMTMINKNLMNFVYLSVGLGQDKDAEKAILNKIKGMIVYGSGTCRGIVGPYVQVKDHPFEYDSIVITPYMKIGVDVLDGNSIKVITDSAITIQEIATLRASLLFTPIDGDVVTSVNALGEGVLNSGASS